jgi:hypothetical protein
MGLELLCDQCGESCYLYDLGEAPARDAAFSEDVGPEALVVLLPDRWISLTTGPRGPGQRHFYLCSETCAGIFMRKVREGTYNPRIVRAPRGGEG